MRWEKFSAEFPYHYGTVVRISLSSSFRDAPQGAGPESITTTRVMDSGLTLRVPRNDDVERVEVHNHQYDFGRPSTFSATKLRISSRLIGAMRGMSDSRK